MPHPIMYRDDDPFLVRLRTVALAFPDAEEKAAHGRPTFRCGKVFGMYGGGTKRAGDVPARRVEQSVLFKPDDSDTAALQQDPRFFVPAYVGSYGWLGLDLTVAEVDWREVAELLDESFRQFAPKRALARLDGGERPAELR
ncbi:MmcQ/YjbR family DNA-binding protein [Tsukamurella soli]|uniref:MmcQ/YjbR family DNA-binding protein n=1 Tax=Tsukamurella soli TaxID=644556 RepID=A0ABP8KA66_9ACTN